MWIINWVHETHSSACLAPVISCFALVLEPQHSLRDLGFFLWFILPYFWLFFYFLFLFLCFIVWFTSLLINGYAVGSYWICHMLICMFSSRGGRLVWCLVLWIPILNLLVLWTRPHPILFIWFYVGNLNLFNNLFIYYLILYKYRILLETM